MFGDKKNKIKDSERSLISETVSIEGTINSSGAIDVAGLVKGPVISKEIVVEKQGQLQGQSKEIEWKSTVIWMAKYQVMMSLLEVRAL